MSNVYTEMSKFMDYPNEAKGPAKAVVDTESDDYKKDTITGYTNPNLHRRIDNTTPNILSGGFKQEYQLGVYSKESIRTTETITHYEENDGSLEATASEQRELP